MCGAPRSGRGAGVHAPQAEFTFRTYCRQTGNYPETGLWEVSYERSEDLRKAQYSRLRSGFCALQQLVTGRAASIFGLSRVSHFQRGVGFRNPVFDFNVKLFCLDEDLFCFCVGRNIGKV
jgi:hypothetical protein